MTFKEKLAILRKTKGLTQDGFAKAIGVSRQSVYKWESGVSYPEIPKLLEIKALFGISLDDLFDDSFEIVLPAKKKRARKEAPEKLTPPESAEEEIKTENKEESAHVQESAPIAEKAESEEERKVGFFGRLFGRK